MRSSSVMLLVSTLVFIVFQPNNVVATDDLKCLYDHFHPLFKYVTTIIYGQQEEAPRGSWLYLFETTYKNPDRTIEQLQTTIENLFVGYKTLLVIGVKYQATYGVTESIDATTNTPIVVQGSDNDNTSDNGAPESDKSNGPPSIDDRSEDDQSDDSGSEISIQKEIPYTLEQEKEHLQEIAEKLLQFCDGMKKDGNCSNEIKKLAFLRGAMRNAFVEIKGIEHPGDEDRFKAEYDSHCPKSDEQT